MELGKHVLDKSLLDGRGRRAGKVDDLLLELPDDGGPPVVVAIISGPLALMEEMPGWLRALARIVYRLLGVRDPRPALTPWHEVTTIDVAVHVQCDRDKAGLNVLSAAVARRFIARIPGA